MRILMEYWNSTNEFFWEGEKIIRKNFVNTRQQTQGKFGKMRHLLAKVDDNEEIECKFERWGGNCAAHNPVINN